ncbi:MAG: hypothetical protein WCS80_01750 [Bacilli bacterium]
MKSKSSYTVEQYKKDRNKYQIFASSPIWFAIIPLLAEVFLQTTLTYTEGTGFSDPKSLGCLLSSAAFGLIGVSGTFNLSLMKSLSAIINVGFALILILLSSYSFKKRGYNLLACTAIYGADTLVTIPLIACSLSGLYPFSLTAVDIVLLIVVHLAGLACLTYSAILEKKVRVFEIEYEKKKALNERINIK